MIPKTRIESKARDAVKEFMNIICGQFVTAMYGTHDVYNLSIPQLKELTETPEFDEEESPHIATFSVSGHGVQVAHESR